MKNIKPEIAYSCKLQIYRDFYFPTQINIRVFSETFSQVCCKPLRNCLKSCPLKPQDYLFNGIVTASESSVTFSQTIYTWFLEVPRGIFSSSWRHQINCPQRNVPLISVAAPQPARILYIILPLFNSLSHSFNK